MARARILQPYTRRVDDTRHRVSRIALVGGLVLLAMFMGFVIAILPMDFMIIPMAPILVLAIIALWLAPDLERNFDGTIRKLLLLYFAAAMVWPDYIALTMPGIGWVSPQRLFLGALLLTSLYALSTSSESRAHVYDVISHVKPLYWMFVIFFVLQFVLAFATISLTSRFFFAQFFWYYMFIVSAWVYSNPNTVRRLYQIILVGLAVQCVYGLLHWVLQRPVWTGYIPPFLLVEPELLIKILGEQQRAGTDILRVNSLFLTALTFAEAIAIFIPFVIFAIFYARNAWFRIAAGALLVFAFFNGIWTDARSAMIGFIVAPVCMIGLWALQRYRRTKADRDIISPAVIWAYPLGMIVVMGAVLFIGRIRVAVLGGGQHQPSNAAREEQWRRTFELLERNPFGYGPFNAGPTVGYRNRGGGLTIDGYMMNLLVDYGVLGWLLFLGLFLGCAALGVKTFLRSETHEEDIAAPLAVAVLNFIIIKLVLSQTENHHIMYAFLGCLVALHWRQEQRIKSRAVLSTSPPVAVDPSPAPPRGPLVPAGGYGVARVR